ncbi:hypothetical protein [Streptomyces altiplanensis]
MDVVVFDGFGGPGVLRLTETEEPCTGPGQVRVKVRAAARPARRTGWPRTPGRRRTERCG